VSQRVVIPELLDYLPGSHPDAQRSRQDLRRINALMGNERWIFRTIRRFHQTAERGIVEIGAGDGMLCQKLARQFPTTRVDAYDLSAAPEGLDPMVRWHQGDLFTQAPPKPGGVLIANLFLHHFEQNSLAALGGWVAQSEVLIFNEPDRSSLPHFLATLMHPWINHVTRHDMHVSIDGGFSTAELPRLLQLDPACWNFRETSTWRGARRVVGLRN